MGLIVTSMCIILRYVIVRVEIKEIKVCVDEEYDARGKEKEILLALIKQYNIAQEDIIEKYNKRSKYFQWSLYPLFVAVVCLCGFIICALPSLTLGNMISDCFHV